MLENNKIFFQNEHIPTLSKFNEHLSDRCNENISPMIANLIRTENILRQRPSVFAFPSRPLHIEELLIVQTLLDILTFLETLKYRNCICNARSVLRKYLYTGFNLKSCFIEPLPATISSVVNISDTLRFGDTNHRINSYVKHHSDPASVREMITVFLSTSANLSQNQNYYYRIMESTQRNDSIQAGREHQPHHYMSIFDIPEFLLSFKYCDGRNFTSWEMDTRLPRVAPNRKCSEISYKMALEDVLQLYTDITNPDPALIVHKHRLNQMFCFNKLQRIEYYRQLYKSEKFLTQMYNTFNLSYSEVINLENNIDQWIFKDMHFINNILASPSLDGFLFFDVPFQFTIFSGIIENVENATTEAQTPKNKLEILIDFYKKQTLEIISTPSCAEPQVYSLLLHALQGNNLDILKLEKIIISALFCSIFFKDYYIEPNEYLAKHITSEVSLPYAFEDIKQAIPPAQSDA